MTTPKAKPAAKRAPAKRAPRKATPKVVEPEAPIPGSMGENGRPVVTGASFAWVNPKDGTDPVMLSEGDEVPEITSDEEDRLAALNVFGTHPRDEARLAELQRVQEALALAGHSAAPVDVEVGELLEAGVTVGGASSDETEDPDAGDGS